MSRRKEQTFAFFLAYLLAENGTAGRAGMGHIITGTSLGTGPEQAITAKVDLARAVFKAAAKTPAV